MSNATTTSTKGNMQILEDLSPERIKEIRGRYGFSQRSFAKVLGIGEASMVRYEKGEVPSKANENLIRAAEIPEFMHDCLQRASADIPRSQRESAERYIYAVVSLEEDEAHKKIAGKEAASASNADITQSKEDQLDEMSEVYQYVIVQEVLNEQAASVQAELFRFRMSQEKENESIDWLKTLSHQLAQIKATIADRENRDFEKLNKISGYLDCIKELIEKESLKAAS